MKINVILLGSLLMSGIAAAQNTNPWPSTGNVGIGTTTPDVPLTIKGAANTSLLKLTDGTYSTIYKQNTYWTTIDASSYFQLNWGTVGSRNEFILQGGTSGKFQLSGNYGAFVNGFNGFKIGHAEKYGFYTNGTSKTYYALGTAWVDNDNSGIAFYSRNAEVETETMRLTSTGRLGIGTTAPATSLHVNGNVTINNSIAGAVTHSNLLLGDGQGAQLNWGTGANMSRVMCGGPVTLWTNNAERFRVNSQGYIGINTNSPTAFLHVNGTVRLAALTADNTKDQVLVTDANGNVYTRTAASLGGTNAWSIDGTTIGSASTKLGTTGNFDLPLITNNIEAVRVTATGNVGIGTANPQAKLAVNGDVYAKKVRVTASGWPTWPDYVFEEGYDLPSLASVEAFIKKNKHLPEVPSAKEVVEKGIDLGDNQAVLLKKIEELTLYVIEQNKKIEALQKEMKEMKK